MTKAIKSLVFLFLLATANVAFGQAPVKQDLAGIATINFPGAPSAEDVPNGMGKFYKLSTPAANYVTIVINIDTAQVVIKSSKDLDLFYSGVVDGAADSAQNRKLVNVRQISVGKYKAVEFKYLDASTDKKFTVYQRLVYLDKVLFMYVFNVYENTPTTLSPEGEKFLDSFTVTRPNAKQY